MGFGATVPADVVVTTEQVRASDLHAATKGALRMDRWHVFERDD
ncbi:hypothetical protein [Sphingomonas faeni]|nr:hypothetical protein [Sphingomonas faeni]MDQ0839344.1 hypothetical protein [Sphingomonas faeni]